MTTSVMDVLVYLFENLADADVDIDAQGEALRGELLEAGFAEAQIAGAFDWLDGLARGLEGPEAGSVAGGQSLDTEPSAARAPGPIRVFTAEEASCLDLQCRGCLLSLEHVGVLDARARELVIDRAMALGPGEVDLERLRWVILMVLLKRSGDVDAVGWVEEAVLGEAGGLLH